MGVFVRKAHGYEKNSRKNDGDHGDQNNFSEHTQSLCIAVIFMRGGYFSAFLRPYGRNKPALFARVTPIFQTEGIFRSVL